VELLEDVVGCASWLPATSADIAARTWMTLAGPDVVGMLLEVVVASAAT
jgi:hypothetical protein